jgi:hypothetical protein
MRSRSSLETMSDNSIAFICVVSLWIIHHYQLGASVLICPLPYDSSFADLPLDLRRFRRDWNCSDQSIKPFEVPWTGKTFRIFVIRSNSTDTTANDFRGWKDETRSFWKRWDTASQQPKRSPHARPKKPERIDFPSRRDSLRRCSEPTVTLSCEPPALYSFPGHRAAESHKARSASVFSCSPLGAPPIGHGRRPTDRLDPRGPRRPWTRARELRRQWQGPSASGARSNSTTRCCRAAAHAIDRGADAATATPAHRIGTAAIGR